MGFDFDKFINKPSMQMFGQRAKIIPAKADFIAFEINGDFHEEYKEVGFDDANSSVTSAKIVIFIRDANLPQYYPKVNQGDIVEINNKSYQIVDIQAHIPGSKKLILHESNQPTSQIGN